MKLSLQLFLLCLIALHLPIPLWAASMDFEGYFRSGLGTNSKGGDQACFTNPGASAFFRLGNECDEYGELTLLSKFTSGQKEDSASFNFYFTLAYSQPGQANWEESPIVIRQAYVESDKFFTSAIKFWAGKRYYRVQDIHILDYAYHDFGPPGAGIEDIEISGFKMAIAYLKGGGTAESDQGSMAMSLADFQFYDIDAGPAGKLSFWLAQALQPGGEGVDASGNAVTYEEVHGQGISLTVEHEFNSGFNKLAIQQGTGLLKELGFIDETFSLIEAEALQKAKTIRITDQLTWDQDKDWSLQAVWVNENRTRQEGDLKWQALGGRFQVYLGQHLNLAFELSHSSVLDQSETDPVERTLEKFTIAPQLQLKPGFWERPLLRAFYTLARWNQANEGLVGGAAFAVEKQGASYGFLAEIWF